MQVEKIVFVIFFSGERARAKILKICDAFGENRYPFPEEFSKQRQMIGEVCFYYLWASTFRLSDVHEFPIKCYRYFMVLLFWGIRCYDWTYYEGWHMHLLILNYALVRMMLTSDDVYHYIWSKVGINRYSLCKCNFDKSGIENDDIHCLSPKGGLTGSFCTQEQHIGHIVWKFD